ncbi:MAG: HAD family phosphatase [Actinomycetota bacterium]|nr:HAD family phosphatase [Actinomycetota bacterium]
MNWLVCDYGEVISLAPRPSDFDALARICDLPPERFVERYWSGRPEYDRGTVDAAAFWSSLAPRPLDDVALASCVVADVASWSRLDPRATDAIEQCARRGWRLALLSNAPAEIARSLDSREWFSRFEHRVFSCDVGSVKPEAEIYSALLSALGAEPSEVTFVDDREANVAAAKAVGIRALLYDGPEVLSGL